MSWNWDKINKVSIDNLSSHVFTDTIFIDRYTNGLFNIILKWAFVIIMICFLVYIIRIFIHKKKI